MFPQKLWTLQETTEYGPSPLRSPIFPDWKIVGSHSCSIEKMENFTDEENQLWSKTNFESGISSIDSVCTRYRNRSGSLIDKEVKAVSTSSERPNYNSKANKMQDLYNKSIKVSKSLEYLENFEDADCNISPPVQESNDDFDSPNFLDSESINGFSSYENYLDNDTIKDTPRRFSLPVSPYFDKFESFGSYQDDQYFEGENQLESLKSMPSHSLFQLSSYTGPLWTVEFKAGRTELFYITETNGISNLDIQVGDLVIVEADRGEDLGRVTFSITIQRLKQIMNSSNRDLESRAKDGKYTNEEVSLLLNTKEINPKRIHRLAQSIDIKLLLAKSQEEALALVRCQSRIRQKRLPMEVVDAEYQW